MPRPKLNEMTLREKVGQTGMPGPGEVRRGVQRFGGYDAYFKQYPFGGLYVDSTIADKDGNKFKSPTSVAQTLCDASNKGKIPLFISCDFEIGANHMFRELHRLTSNMSLGAALSKELAYERGYMWAKEMKSLGVNWPFGPVGDLLGNFFSTSGVRCMSDRTEVVTEIFPCLIKGIQDAGVAGNAKHFPSGSRDYRDTCN